MKNIINIICLFVITLFSFNSNAQFENPIESWSYEVDYSKQKPMVIVKGVIKDGWHFYSQENDAAMPTEFSVENENVVLDLPAKEIGVISHYSDIFEADENYFEKDIYFEIPISFKNKPGNFELFINGQACTEEGMCIPLEKMFEVNIDRTKIKSSINKTSVTNQKVTKEKNVVANHDKEPLKTSSLTSQDSVKKDYSSTPIKVTSSFDTTLKNEMAVDLVNEQSDKDQTTSSSDKTMIGIFIAGFLGGLLALLTPCVFPLIPMTVSFFTKSHSKDEGVKGNGVSKALLYGFFIIAIYVGLGLIITAAFGADALNSLASNGVMNFIFFVVFVVFAISFLGAFEIRIPYKFVNKIETKSDKGGIVGIFFMAFTLALVSFSCTGPIIGSLLVEASTKGNYLGPAIGMFGFSLALALPFMLFSMFPSWLNSLPKSGGWLNTVKVVLGFLELALAFKFLSVVDMAYHWDILTRELFIAIWIIIFVLLGLYLLGKLKFSHDSDIQFISIPRLFFAITFFTFVIYMLPGLVGAPLKLLSGIAPPTHHSEDQFRFIRGYDNLELDDEYGKYMKEGAFGLLYFSEYEKGLAYAKKVNKPVFLDFTGHSCTNCRLMENNVWIDPAILNILRNDYVIISLYVDDKTMLPKNEQYVSETTGNRVRTIGNKWSDFEAKRFGKVSQPYYVLLNHDQEELNSPVGYTPNVKEYEKFLLEGLQVFK